MRLLGIAMGARIANSVLVPIHSIVISLHFSGTNPIIEGFVGLMSNFGLAHNSGVDGRDLAIMWHRIHLETLERRPRRRHRALGRLVGSLGTLRA